MVNEHALIFYKSLREGGAANAAPPLEKENQEIKKPVEETGFPVKPEIR
ncbi:MAG: hypothetical protein JRF39_11960 [Deltaproteobacteria bacterium]|nr:hypothetical protein [Deltaproteobacteria bacterium]